MLSEKKKVSIITIFDNTNYGTYLQALALGVVVKQQGFYVEYVNYCRSFQNFKFRIKEYLQNTRNPFRWVLRFIRLYKSYSLLKYNHKFIKRYIDLSISYKSFEELVRNPPVADIYMTGSDQVWNSIHNRGIDRSFYLEYAPEGATRVSYASSIGMEVIPGSEQEITLSLLRKYKSVSVRESSAKKILEGIGLSNVHIVLDPTLLLDKNQWMKYIKKTTFEKKEPYLIVYSVETKEQDIIINELARKIAAERKMKIYGVYYGGPHYRIECCDKNYFRATPDLFLSLFSQADFAVVSSFHGTAFSVNFNLDFFTVIPDRFNSRIDSLLEMCHLQDRRITKVEDVLESSIASIDYKMINAILKQEREGSLNVMSCMLNN